MKPSLPRLLSKLLAISLLGGALVLGYALVVGPYLGSLQELRLRIAAERELLGRLASEAGRSGQATTAPQGEEPDSQLFLSGSSDAVRTAALQSLLGKIADAQGALTRSIRPLAPREQGGLRLIGIEAQLAASLPQVQSMLYDLESSRPFVFIDVLRLTRPMVSSDAASASATPLEVRISLSAAAGQTVR